MIQWLDNLRSPVLDSLQSVHIFLLLGSLELDIIALMRPYQCWAERKDHFFHPSDKALPIAAQEALWWPFMETHCWPVTSSSAIAPKVLLWRGAFQLVRSQCLQAHEAIFHRMQDFSFTFVELYKAPVGPFLQSAQVPLNGSTALWFISHHSQFFCHPQTC